MMKKNWQKNLLTVRQLNSWIAECVVRLIHTIQCCYWKNSWMKVEWMDHMPWQHVLLYAVLHWLESWQSWSSRLLLGPTGRCLKSRQGQRCESGTCGLVLFCISCGNCWVLLLARWIALAWCCWGLQIMDRHCVWCCLCQSTFGHLLVLTRHLCLCLAALHIVQSRVESDIDSVCPSECCLVRNFAIVQ